MRKLIALLAVSVVTVSALAQGTVNFNNNVWTGTSARPVFADRADTIRLVGTDYVAQLYFGTQGTAEGSLTAVGALGRFRVATTSSPGTWGSGSTITLPGITAGQTASLQVRVWNATLFPAGYAAAVATPGALTGASAVFSYTVPSGGTPAPNEFWMNNFASFHLVPEPSTIALGVLGLAGLLFIRRRK